MTLPNPPFSSNLKSFLWGSKTLSNCPKKDSLGLTSSSPYQTDSFINSVWIELIYYLKAQDAPNPKTVRVEPFPLFSYYQLDSNLLLSKSTGFLHIM